MDSEAGRAGRFPPQESMDRRAEEVAAMAR